MADLDPGHEFKTASDLLRPWASWLRQQSCSLDVTGALDFTVSGTIANMRAGCHPLVTRLLLDHQVPSVSSTFVWRHAALQPQVVSSSVRRAFILRILRYISPHPWGSPLAEAGREFQRLEGIAARLFSWNLPPNHAQGSAFSMGGGVLWRCGVLSPTSKRFVALGDLPKDWMPGQSAELCWMAHRAPPRREEISSIVFDITGMVINNLTRPADGQDHGSDLLWDHRFKLTLRPWLLPAHYQDMIRSDEKRWPIAIRPMHAFQLPEVVMGKSPDLIRLGGYTKAQHSGAPELVDTAWLQVTFIREITAA